MARRESDQRASKSSPPSRNSLLHEAAGRAALVRRGLWLSRMTLIYNAGEGLAAIITGLLAGSVALIGFGVDSIIEVVSSLAALCRLSPAVHAASAQAAQR